MQQKSPDARNSRLDFCMIKINNNEDEDDNVKNKSKTTITLRE